ETLRGGLGRLVNSAARSKVAEVIGHPIFGFAAYAFFIPFTHLTSIFNLMLTHSGCTGPSRSASSSLATCFGAP
ncbi:MAG: hypothetical protein WCI12_10835, partial [Actinomycetes bacterium]